MKNWNSPAIRSLVHAGLSEDAARHDVTTLSLIPASVQVKAEIRAKEMGDLGNVRKKLADLEAENAELKGRIAEMVVTRRDPPDLDSWKEKVTILERQLADAIKTAQDATATKK